ncbi:MAG: hypothetical protein RLZZ565_49, partial [Planctomycetota bacterium]
MKTILLAYHEIGAAALDALVASSIDVVAVLTHRDDPQEGGWYRSVAAEAAKHGIPVYAPEDPNHPIWIERLAALKPDALVSAHYRRMVSAEFLAIFPRGGFNLHASLLPRFRGRAPINWVLVEGETETGVTLHEMTDAPDAGPILGQRSIAIDRDDTALSLTRKACVATRELLGDLLPKIASGTAPRTPQDERHATVMPARRPEDGRIDWSQDAERIRNLVRAVTRPWPGAFTQVGDRKFFIWQAETVAGESGEPGEVLSVDPLVV